MNFKSQALGRDKLSYLLTTNVNGVDLVVGIKNNDGTIQPRYFKNSIEIERFIREQEKEQQNVE